MGRRIITAAVAIAALAAASAPAHLDHPVPGFAPPSGPLSSAVNAGGEGAEWELIATIPTGNAHTDLDFFTHKGETYVSVGTLAVGPNAGGQTIVRLTDGGNVDPVYITGHPSASCVTTTSSATGLQHDVEATPKGDTLPHQFNPHIAKGDAQLLVESTDGPGRCHDQGTFGQQAPNGGLEIIDVTDPAAPKELALTVHTGQAHTVNVDPKRPHIAFDVTQDNVAVDAEGKRANETSGNALDGFELLDLSSCMNFPPGTALDVKRERCRPQVYRYRYEKPAVGLSHTYRNLQGCHEVEIYPDDALTCAGIDATMLFDLSGAFDDRGTPADFTDDRPRGTPLPCAVRDSSSAGGVFGTGAKVIDCHNGSRDGQPQSLIVSEWLKIGAPSLEGVRWIGTVPHMGFGATVDIATTPYDATQDIVAAHESELTASGRFVLTSDERGGGVVPRGATCEAGDVNLHGNGGIHAFPIASFTTSPPTTPEDSWKLWARDSEGRQAVYRAPTRTGAAGDFCTAHVFQQIPGQNRIFMGWYSQGTQVVDFVENPNGTIDFKDAGWFTPEAANTWTSHVFKVLANQDGSFTYFGATGDGIVPGTGRSAIDVYKVTLPAPPQPFAQPGRPVGSPRFPVTDVRGQEPGGGQQPGGGLPPCARTSAFEAVGVRPRGRSLTFSFSQRGSVPVDVDLFQQSRGRRIVGERRVVRFGAKRSAFRWNGRARRRLRDGVYFARFRAQAPDGRADVRRVALQRRRGRYRVLPDFDRRTACGLLEAFKLQRPVFGGTRRRALSASFRLSAAARVTIEVRRGGRRVHRYRARTYDGARTHRIRVHTGRARRGVYTVTLRAVRAGRTTSATLTARRL